VDLRTITMNAYDTTRKEGARSWPLLTAAEQHEHVRFAKSVALRAVEPGSRLVREINRILDNFNLCPNHRTALRRAVDLYSREKSALALGKPEEEDIRSALGLTADGHVPHDTTRHVTGRP